MINIGSITLILKKREFLKDVVGFMRTGTVDHTIRDLEDFRTAVEQLRLVQQHVDSIRQRIKDRNRIVT